MDFFAADESLLSEDELMSSLAPVSFVEGHGTPSPLDSGAEDMVGEDSLLWEGTNSGSLLLESFLTPSSVSGEAPHHSGMMIDTPMAGDSNASPLTFPTVVTRGGAGNVAASSLLLSVPSIADLHLLPHSESVEATPTAAAMVLSAPPLGVEVESSEGVVRFPGSPDAPMGGFPSPSPHSGAASSGSGSDGGMSCSESGDYHMLPPSSLSPPSTSYSVPSSSTEYPEEPESRATVTLPRGSMTVGGHHLDEEFVPCDSGEESDDAAELAAVKRRQRRAANRRKKSVSPPQKRSSSHLSAPIEIYNPSKRERVYPSTTGVAGMSDRAARTAARRAAKTYHVEEVSRDSAAGVTASNSDDEEIAAAEEAGMDVAALRRLRNRKSAARSRAKKQQQLEDAIAERDEARDRLAVAEAENEALRAQMNAARVLMKDLAAEGGLRCPPFPTLPASRSPMFSIPTAHAPESISTSSRSSRRRTRANSGAVAVSGGGFGRRSRSMAVFSVLLAFSAAFTRTLPGWSGILGGAGSTSAGDPLAGAGSSARVLESVGGGVPESERVVEPTFLPGSKSATSLVRIGEGSGAAKGPSEAQSPTMAAQGGDSTGLVPIVRPGDGFGSEKKSSAVGDLRFSPQYVERMMDAAAPSSGNQAVVGNSSSTGASVLLPYIICPDALAGVKCLETTAQGANGGNSTVSGSDMGVKVNGTTTIGGEKPKMCGAPQDQLRPRISLVVPASAVHNSVVPSTVLNESPLPDPDAMVLLECVVEDVRLLSASAVTTDPNTGTATVVA